MNLLVAIEGCDGAGTATQAKLLAEALAGRQIPCHLTRQPSDGPIGRMIREVLAGTKKIPPEALALLFAADRIDHMEREVEPAWNDGMIVVSDRWYHSSFAYNVDEDNVTGFACLQELVPQDRSWIVALNAFARRPDLTILLDIRPEVAAERRVKAGRATELFDDIETQRRVVARYRRLMSWMPAMTALDGEREVGAIAREIFLRVDELITLHRRA